jgi:hypothetical protein
MSLIRCKELLLSLDPREIVQSDIDSGDDYLYIERPDEIEELLETLSEDDQMKFEDFEVDYLDEFSNCNGNVVLMRKNLGF